MSEQDPPRMLDDLSIDAPTRDALRSLAEPAPPYDPATASRVGALIAARTATSWLSIAVVGALALGVAAVPLAARWARAGRARVDGAPHASPVATIAPNANANANARTDASAPRAEPPPLAVPDERAPSAARSPASTTGPNARAASTPAARAAHERVERDLLADAQRALERDADPRRALSLLAEHRRRFERSPLDEERSYLALRAYARLGDRAALERSGSVFLRRFASSIYAPAARRLLGSAP